MYIQQTDLFRGVSKDFLKKIMDITVKESRAQGDYLFHEGDPAIYAYVLLKGRVDLSIGERGHVVFVVSRPGEAFGWSSIIGRDVYSASAECKAATRLLQMDRDKFQKILENDPVNGFIFFKRLAGTLGNRLLQSYNQISAVVQLESSLSFGTGQILGSTLAQ
jgi:CRP-like cAMP-binding protein